MDNMNEIIAKLRKDAGLTQEQLASIIGVSPQAVSKWETGTTMPDILLLPVIADIFDKDIDYLFGRLREKTEADIRKDNIHEEAYNFFFEMMQNFWGDGESDKEAKKKAEECREFIKSHTNTQTMILSNREGNGVFADCNIALTFIKNKNDIKDLFEDDAAFMFLKRFTDGQTKNVYRFIINNRGRTFTSSFIAAKCGIEATAAERALDNLLRMNLISRTDLDTEEGTVYLYSAFAYHKSLLIYSILAMASRLGNYEEVYRGFMS